MQKSSQRLIISCLHFSLSEKGTTTITMHFQMITEMVSRGIILIRRNGLFGSLKNFILRKISEAKTDW